MEEEVLKVIDSLNKIPNSADFIQLPLPNISVEKVINYISLKC